MGSKNRHANEILNIILKDRNSRLFVDPFVGGANIIDKVLLPILASDIDPDLIILYKAVSKGWIPPETFTEEQYRKIKNESPSPLRSYAAFALSYGGKKWGGWRRDKQGKRNYVKEAYNNAIKQFPQLRGINFQCCSYENLTIPDNSIIYCDPPYENTTKYKGTFNYNNFWNWCRKMSISNEVYVSEYNAPEDFICLWQKSVPSSLTQNTGAKYNIEKLFTLK